MGYLTTVTIYNDGLDLLKKHPEEFCEKLYNAASSFEQVDFGLGYFSSFATVQASRHADDHTIYVHRGNTVSEVNPWSRDFESMLKRNPQFAGELVQYLNQQVKRLKKMVAAANPPVET